MGTNGKTTMAKWLSGGISKRGDREENPDRDKPNSEIADAYCLATRAHRSGPSDDGNQTCGVMIHKE